MMEYSWQTTISTKCWVLLEIWADGKLCFASLEQVITWHSAGEVDNSLSICLCYTFDYLVSIIYFMI